MNSIQRHLSSLLPLLLLFASSGVSAQRSVRTLKEGWEFTKGRATQKTVWEKVRVPHDWAIYGPFNRANDLQTVAVEQNGETEKTEKTGRTGGLPFIGKGTYRTTFEVEEITNKNTFLLFDGAMSNAHVFVNGKEVAFWPYGYNSFYVDVSAVVRRGSNALVVELENFERASRWYPGAGLYRNVHLITTNKVHIPVWGTFVTTPEVTPNYASVRLTMDIAGALDRQNIHVCTVILNPEGEKVAMAEGIYCARGQEYTQAFVVEDPALWSPETPALYVARTTLQVDGKVVDTYDTQFGIRSIAFIPEKGFFLNGTPTKFKGVCNHHDLGPLGAAVNRSALRHQIELLKDMGVNAIRTAHNMPAPELVELCDEMGIMLMIEPFDDWGFQPKSPNGYGAFFNEWADKDISNMVRHFRNNPSVVMRCRASGAPLA